MKEKALSSGLYINILPNPLLSLSLNVWAHLCESKIKNDKLRFHLFYKFKAWNVIFCIEDVLSHIIQRGNITFFFNYEITISSSIWLHRNYQTNFKVTRCNDCNKVEMLTKTIFRKMIFFWVLKYVEVKFHKPAYLRSSFHVLM